MRFKVVYTSVPPIDLDKTAFTTLGVEYVEKPAPSEDDLIAAAGDADVLIARSEPCTPKVVAGLQKCRLIVTPKVGYDNIDIAAATVAGMCVANVPGLSVDEVSDHAMALLLSCARKITRLNSMVKVGGWKVFHGREMQDMWRGITQLRGQTVGLVGFGSISRALAPKAQAFGLNVISYDPFIPTPAMEKLAVRCVSLEQLLQEADYVSVHTPLTAGTRKMLGAAQFGLMKKTAFFINTSRGAIVDENALCEALTRGLIAGAGLDVLAYEPIKMDNPLLQMDNVIVTGHSAHYSDQAWDEQARRPAEEVARLISGQWPRGWVNPQVEANYVARWGKPEPLITGGPG
jgi:D-3-phosphoglycerate dehydrogenase / 2-oxoglutarate reductase